jgi:hypothetical protein
MFWIISLFSLLHLQGQFICQCTGVRRTTLFSHNLTTDADKFLLKGNSITINPSSTKSYLTTCYLEKLMRSSKEAETKVKDWNFLMECHLVVQPDATKAAGDSTWGLVSVTTPANCCAYYSSVQRKYTFPITCSLQSDHWEICWV